MADDAAGKPPEMTAFSAVTEVDIMTGGDGNETFVIDPSAFSEGVTLAESVVALSEVIADYTEGQDVLDLSDLLASLGPLLPADAAEAAAPASVPVSASTDVDSSSAAAGGSFEDAASLTGVHATIAILYDDNQPDHTTTVT